METVVRYEVRVTRDSDESWVAEVLDLPGCFASATDLHELEEALTEAISLYLSTTSINARVSRVDLHQRPLPGVGEKDEDVPVPTHVELALV